jgi:hypothetical protein
MPVLQFIQTQDLAAALEMARHGIDLVIPPLAVLPISNMIDLRVSRLLPWAHRSHFAETTPEAREPASVAAFLYTIRHGPSVPVIRVPYG